MKRFLLVWLTVLSLTAGAQTYNNEWIDYSRTYYKFKVGATGLHRLPQSLLAQMNLGATNAEHFQLWRNGKQVPIYTSVQTGVLGASDYIEFWGEMNDGKADNPLYRESDYQISDHWSLQTDTAAYFLTVNGASANFRLIPTSNNIAANTLPVEPYFMHVEGRYPRVQINSGRAEQVLTSTVYSSSYDYGEGWTGAYIGAQATELYPLNGLVVYSGTGAPSATLRLSMCGTIMNERRYRIRLNGDSILGASLDYFEYTKTGKIIPASTIASGVANIEVTNISAISNDRMVVGQLELTYPRRFDFGGATNFPFTLPANIAGNYLEITNFSNSGSAPVLYDLTNGRRYEMNTATPGVLKVLLQPSSVDRSLVLVSEAASNVKTLNEMERRNFIDYAASANQGDFLIITNTLLTAASGTGDPVEDYRQYRSSAAGGGFNAKVYLIDQLIDQYAFGIKMHPLSIRNFVRRARENNSVKPRYVLLIGKGVTYTSFRSLEYSSNMVKLQMVPTFGNPASDNLLTAQGNSSVPLVPIGRLAVINKAEITAYLEKLKTHEQTAKATAPGVADAGWKKNIIHVTGASDEETSRLLADALNGHKRIIEDTAYGGNVSTFTKTSADAVQQVSSTQISNLFRAGVGILTYFGHSSATTLEFNLDNPNAYDNSGKYPIFIVMGCNAGNFYLYNEARLVVKETISENYVLAPGKGAVAFLASTHLGVVHYLDIYNTRFYRAMSTTHYGRALGDIMDEAISQMLSATGSEDFYARFQCEQFTLHGDPAVKPYSFEKPDLAIEAQMVKVTPAFIPISETEFKVVAQYANLGKTVNKKFVVSLKRTYPDNTTELIRKDTVVLRKYTDSLVYTIPIVATRDVGLNKLTVSLDEAGEIDELYETNNIVTKDFYIIEDDVRPVSPYNYTIVNDAHPTLVASSANPFAPVRNYRVEVDTTQAFNSPLMTTSNATSAGGVFEFNPAMNLTDSSVYYWRVSPANITGEPVWNYSSFQYIANGQPGFSQAHYYQFLKNKFDKIQYTEDRKFKFTESVSDIDVKTGVYQVGHETGNYSLAINGVRVQAGFYSPLAVNANSIRFYVIDRTTNKPWKNVSQGATGMYGSYNPTPLNSTVLPGFFLFDLASTTGRQSAMNFIDQVPDGDYIIMTNSGYGSTVLPPVWLNDTMTLGSGKSLYHKIQSLGVTQLPAVTSYVPFIFVVRKGDTQPIREIVSTYQYELPVAIFEIRGVQPDGYMESDLIGPSKRWETLKWKGSSIEPATSDHPEIKVLGVRTSGQVDTLVTVTEGQLTASLASIDAAVYPNIKLRLHTRDSVNFTPFQLKYWMVSYDPVPEGAIASNTFLSIKDTVDVGEPLNVGIGFKNVSNVPFDSIKVNISITDKHNVEHIIQVPNQKPLNKNEVLQVNVPIDTKSFSGENTLYINFNPDRAQPEHYVFNNYAFKSIFVRPDTLQPLLDVTFDGVHILNSDIVSAKPAILIKLKDEAKWMPLDDPNLVSVQVKFPSGVTRSYSFANTDTLQFHPAGQGPNTENSASIDFKPFLNEDGDYELLLTGKDKSENSAGGVAYRVNFKVINKPMISNMLNYPNPFTTSTAFVFTLTGSEVPQNIRIQILTITGKIVRDITKEELGPIHIGRNISEFKWDGTDQYGQKLANGVYLYRVITNQHGKALDKYKADNDNTDKFFNNGYGKMYLMR
ncbi:MAG: C25 family cysteine peptidase [Chitinophagaceae bacterium]